MPTESSIDFVAVISDGVINQMSSPVDEIQFVEKGLSIEGFREFEVRLQLSAHVSDRLFHTSRRTLERAAKSNKRLSSSISENGLALARLATIGTEYFGSVKRWKDWLNTPHIQFNNLPPESVMHTQQGRELIKRIVRGMEYGFTA